MFEAAELGRKVSKADFTERANAVHTELLAVQRKLRESKTSVIVIVSGVEGAGKGEVVNRFHEWLDARGIQTFAYWDESDEERERPPLWRFWRNLPPRGTIGIMFGSWYTRPIINRVFGNIDDSSFEREMARISELEQMLTADGALIVKFWFHLPKDVQRARLQQDIKEQKKSWKISPITKKFSKRYDAFASVSERAIRITDTGYAPWYIVESSDRRYRDLTTGATLLDAIEERLKHAPTTAVPAPIRKVSAPDTSESKVTVLDRVDLGKKLEEKKYSRLLRRYQRELYDLAWRARQRNINTIAVFEGWDAAGKGGAIRRVTAGIDARLYRVISVAAPTDEERAQHYLWRFWRQKASRSAKNGCALTRRSTTSRRSSPGTAPSCSSFGSTWGKTSSSDVSRNARKSPGKSTRSPTKTGVTGSSGTPTPTPLTTWSPTPARSTLPGRCCRETTKNIRASR
jgi:polyphosphate kinase 2 (PPK2 family)